jgi:D-alanyl-D-alanine carboxypeptidase
MPSVRCVAGVRSRRCTSGSVKILADVNVSRRVVERLRDRGFSVVRVSEVADPRSRDEDIIALARTMKAVIVSHISGYVGDTRAFGGCSAIVDQPSGDARRCRCALGHPRDCSYASSGRARLRCGDHRRGRLDAHPPSAFQMSRSASGGVYPTARERYCEITQTNRGRGRGTGPLTHARQDVSCEATHVRLEGLELEQEGRDARARKGADAGGDLVVAAD